jgi:prepilin signal peptidase PulO-like enzyme (type II secretory pathway)
MQAINLIFMLELAAIAYIDFKTFRIPLWALVALGVLIVLRGHINAMDAIYGLSMMIGSMFIGDFIMKRETIGGGDIWLGTAMSTFMGFDRFLITYTVAALLGMVAMMTVHRKFQSFDMAYAPYLAVGAFVAMVIK